MYWHGCHVKKYSYSIDTMITYNGSTLCFLLICFLYKSSIPKHAQLDIRVISSRRDVLEADSCPGTGVTCDEAWNPLDSSMPSDELEVFSSNVGNAFIAWLPLLEMVVSEFSAVRGVVSNVAQLLSLANDLVILYCIVWYFMVCFVCFKTSVLVRLDKILWRKRNESWYDGRFVSNVFRRWRMCRCTATDKRFDPYKTREKAFGTKWKSVSLLIYLKCWLT